ncbi:MAG: type II toxin-antitoxin system VapC family toxin [Saccharopolyspora sp.]|uniref:type II toxin-antitoxin system VapC family toxin n=1 Tax=Saccharopolyspora TaxID=1835 RepID=UPI001909EED7|nr:MULTISPECIES: type II toxin-antitoxin system VapC family toxin [unclassified Saccharopolyspora]MBK0868206.1 type II toxin-antitoxin system VapC family toxin [Saccharopolyspora sp. HNM0986]MBQ6640020.1 type II toxin-antitoxin system VapC family toxin [Saccharopolyspora sp.]
MIACDVNVLVNAHNVAMPEYDAYSAWLEEALNGTVPVGIPSLVFSGYLRVITHPRIFPRPFRPEQALEEIAAIRAAPAFVAVEPGPRHWEIFTELCRKADAIGNHVPNAYLAAIAIEHGCEWITADRGFARYPGLRWRHPLD